MSGLTVMSIYWRLQIVSIYFSLSVFAIIVIKFSIMYWRTNGLWIFHFKLYEGFDDVFSLTNLERAYETFILNIYANRVACITEVFYFKLIVLKRFIEQLSSSNTIRVLIETAIEWSIDLDVFWTYIIPPSRTD